MTRGDAPAVESPDRARRLKESIALLVATAATALGLGLVPSWSASPCHVAAVLGGLTILLLFVTRWFGERAVAFEIRLAAAFLASMPLVYIASWFFTEESRVSLWVELAALPLYAGFSALGLRRSPWFLVIGVAAHGLGWDLWHRASAVVPTWYAEACLLVDLGLALYFAARVPVWRASRRQGSSRGGR